MFAKSIALLAFVATSLPAGAAVAGKPAPAPTGSSIALSSGATSAAVGTWMTFVTSYPSSAKNPAIRVVCSQNGATVWSQVGTTDGSYKLGGDSSPWLQVGGDASCVADLVNISWSHGVESMTLLAETKFTGTT